MSLRLEARGLSIARAGRRVIDTLELRLRAGEAVALIGPNASGKSTLLRGLCGLLPAAAGEVRIDGEPLRSWARDALARRIALVAADDGVPSPLTVADRVALGRYPHRGPFRPLTDADQAAIARAFELTGIGALAHRPLGRLSAGERQLAGLARGLAQQPQTLLLDEPAAHLDIGHELQLFRVLDQIRAEGVAVLAVVHDLQRAAAWAERMLLLVDGRLAAEGPPDAVLSSEAAARAFRVTITQHQPPGAARPFYDFG
jgi:ABC-type cobalamin/Fe3+-siderophores transport system ATPase subunit